MKKTISVLSAVVSIFLLTNITAAGSGADLAYETVLSQVLNGDATGKRVYCSDDATSPGMTVQGWRQSVTLPDASGNLCFVDDDPEANWEHPARLVFVDTSAGACRVYELKTPPKDFSTFREMGTYVPKPRAASRARSTSSTTAIGESAAALSVSAGNTPDPAITDSMLSLGPGHKFAVLLSGGYDKDYNHVRYWNDISLLYKVLTRVYGYSPANIYVLAADGTDPAVDRSDGVSSPTDLDGDGIADIQYPATKAAIEQVFGILARRMQAGDFLFVFTTDHGGQDETDPSMGTLYLWQDFITATDFAAQVNRVTACDTMVFAMEQCYSGGFKDYLSGPGRIFMSAAAWDESSYAMGPDYEYDEFSYYLTCALAGARPDGGTVSADRDWDGTVSLAEAYAFATENDTADETPQFDDQSALSKVPDVGANVVSLDGRFGTSFILYTDRQVIDFSVDATAGTQLKVFVRDWGTPGDLWSVSLGSTAPLRGFGGGSWFSPATVTCNGTKTARVRYYSGGFQFPAQGIIKFVLHGGAKKKMDVQVKEQ